MSPKVFCSMVHRRFMRYNNFRYYKFICWYSIGFNDIKFSRYFKLCFLILPLNYLLGDVMQCFCYDLLVFKFWWPPSLSIIMYVNYSNGEKNFLWKFVISTLYLMPTRLKMLFFKFEFSKLIVFIFKLFQSPKLIKYVLVIKLLLNLMAKSSA